MNTKLSTLLQPVRREQLPEDFENLLSLAAAIAAARRVVLPSGVIVHAETYYNSVAKPLIATVLDEVNETSIIDYGTAEEAARQFWLVRYYTAFPSPVVSVPANEKTALTELLGCGCVLTPDLVERVQKNATVLTRLINAISATITSHAAT